MLYICNINRVDCSINLSSEEMCTDVHRCASLRYCISYIHTSFTDHEAPDPISVKYAHQQALQYDYYCNRGRNRWIISNPHIKTHSC